MSREELKPLVGKRRQRFTGTFIRTGFTHNIEEQATILLRNVELDGIVVIQHIWLPYTKDLVKLGMLWPGDIISFTAMVVEYNHAGEKYMVGNTMYTDNYYQTYGIQHPKKFELIKVSDMPEGVARYDITYLKTSSDFQTELNQFVKGLSYQIRIHDDELDIPRESDETCIDKYEDVENIY